MSKYLFNLNFSIGNSKMRSMSEARSKTFSWSGSSRMRSTCSSSQVLAVVSE